MNRMRRLVYIFTSVALLVTPVAMGLGMWTWQPPQQDKAQSEQGLASQPEEPTPAELRRQARTFDRHTVAAGETAYSIARSYGISLTTLVEDNPGVDPTQISLGQTLLIRKKEQGKTASSEVTREWEDLRDAATRDSQEYVYHIVKPGETLYSLGRMFGVAADALSRINGLGEGGLKAGVMIRIPIASALRDVTQIENNTRDWNGFPHDRRRENGQGYYHPQGSTRQVALMLPLAGTTAAGNDFVDFYKGALLALEDLKGEGRSLNVTLYDTSRSPEMVREIVTSHEFADTDLIIGPVYENEMDYAVQFAEVYEVPVVSPLATIRELDSDALYQMAPDPATKYDKVAPMLRSDANIILVSSGAGNDAEFEREILSELQGRNYGRFTLGGSGDIATLIDWDRENVFIVLAGTELTVDRALASISSAYNNASARRGRKAAITVLGSSKWANYNSSIDKNLFFKLNVCFLTSYYINHLNPIASRFEKRYLAAYGGFPSRSSFRGYDTMALFGGTRDLRYSGSPGAEVTISPLGTPYNFVQMDGHRRRVNDQWMLVRFTDDYNITTL